MVNLVNSLEPLHFIFHRRLAENLICPLNEALFELLKLSSELSLLLAHNRSWHLLQLEF